MTTGGRRDAAWAVWIEKVASTGVDLVWDYKSDEPPPGLDLELEHDQLDALSIGPPAYIAYAVKTWNQDHEDLIDPELADPFRVDLAPDRLTKANISGGAPYGVELPFAGVDPPFGNGEWSAPLVEYLRDAIRWGGFPGLARHGSRADVVQLVTRLARDLEPF